MGLDALLGGVVSSLIAVALVGAYSLGRRRYLDRSLKGVLGLHSSSCLIVAPIFHQDVGSELIHYRDAYAFGHLFALCHRLKVEAHLVPYHRLSEVSEATDTFTVGGPLSNALTDAYLKKYVPGFRLVHQQEANGFRRAVLADGNNVTGLAFSERKLLANNEEEWGILLKLSGSELDQHRTVHVIFGYSGRGTAAAAYFLWKEYRQIYRAFGKSRFCIGVRVPRNEGYKVVPRSFEDLTDDAFGQRSNSLLQPPPRRRS